LAVSKARKPYSIACEVSARVRSCFQAVPYMMGGSVRGQELQFPVLVIRTSLVNQKILCFLMDQKSCTERLVHMRVRSLKSNAAVLIWYPRLEHLQWETADQDNATINSYRNRFI
jgi:hypothetical protein